MQDSTQEDKKIIKGISPKKDPKWQEHVKKRSDRFSFKSSIPPKAVISLDTSSKEEKKRTFFRIIPSEHNLKSSDSYTTETGFLFDSKEALIETSKNTFITKKAESQLIELEVDMTQPAAKFLFSTEAEKHFYRLNPPPNAKLNERSLRGTVISSCSLYEVLLREEKNWAEECAKINITCAIKNCSWEETYFWLTDICYKARVLSLHEIIDIKEKNAVLFQTSSGTFFKTKFEAIVYAQNHSQLKENLDTRICEVKIAIDPEMLEYLTLEENPVTKQKCLMIDAKNTSQEKINPVVNYKVTATEQLDKVVNAKRLVKG